jgi:hypothetical protein
MVIYRKAITMVQIICISMGWECAAHM